MKCAGSRRRAAVFGVARVQVQDRGTCLGGVDRVVGDLIGRYWQMGDIDGVWIEPVMAQVMMILDIGCPL